MTENTINYLKRKYPRQMGRMEILWEFLLSQEEYKTLFGRDRIFTTDYVINMLKNRI
jgi:hypothetical protein